VIKKPVYDPKKDGNVFHWILGASETYREMRRIETNAIKEAAEIAKRLDESEVEN
jgi:hypothetical protein